MFDSESFDTVSFSSESWLLGDIVQVIASITAIPAILIPARNVKFGVGNRVPVQMEDIKLNARYASFSRGRWR